MRTASGITHQIEDSAAIVRFDLSSRRIDTVAFVRVEGQTVLMSAQADGSPYARQILRAFVPQDDWALLSTGAIAVLRSQDYHVVVIEPGQHLQRAKPIRFAWRRRTDEEKQAAIDSLSNMATDAMRRMTATAGASPAMPSPFILPSASDLPDYHQAFVGGAARADLTGRIWVRTTAYASDGLVNHDIVNSEGALVDRVRLPRNSSIACFGQKGILFIAHRDSSDVYLERVRER